MSESTKAVHLADKARPQGMPFLRLAFRPFFLLGACFSVFSLGLWAAVLTGVLAPRFYGGPIWWHAHEMLFGFVAAIVAGFLLTAVQTWTGVPGIRGKALAGLVLLWLSARLAMLMGDIVPQSLAALLDLLFLPVVAAVLARSVILVRQWRNIIFLPVLLLMSAANALMHYSVIADAAALQPIAGRATVLLITLLMTIVAGRVVPMFTANGTGTERVEALPWLERLCIVSMICAVVVGTAASSLPPALTALTFLAAAALQLLRVLRWRFWVTLNTPLVWSLHLSYWSIPLGLLLFGLTAMPAALVTQTQALHALTVGGMGLMILAMISRVSLGHTGRSILVGPLMALAFASVYGAFVVRVFGSYLMGSHAHMIIAAVGLWVLGYSCFVLQYLPILVRTRIDGRPG